MDWARLLAYITGTVERMGKLKALFPENKPSLPSQS
jgi:hypothetical protein